ncbi:helix-turn-helix domain-containing protein [Flavobacteriaceae bacterium R38]|nr:helix-turn-helix domain-containing protein [Flavobacteriaceae bacterium R38]
MANVTPETLDEIKAISFFSTSLYHKESTEEVLWDITKNVIHKLGFVDCVIYEFLPKKKILIQRAAYGRKNPFKTIIHNQISIKLGEGIVGHVAKNMKPELIKNTDNDTRYIIDDTKRYSELCVPIIINDKIFGVIDSEHPDIGFFTEKHLHLLTIIATLCAQKIRDLQIQYKKPFTKSNSYFRKLESLIKTKKIYRDPHLSLSTTAGLLGISSCYLSSLVNTITKKSFIDYINEYRVAEVKKNLRSKEFNHYTIVSVGLEAGFNSKSTFYTAFKKHTGMSPSDFRGKAPLHVRVLSHSKISDTLAFYPA